jgi:hypothetical protein
MSTTDGTCHALPQKRTFSQLGTATGALPSNKRNNPASNIASKSDYNASVSLKQQFKMWEVRIINLGLNLRDQEERHTWWLKY